MEGVNKSQQRGLAVAGIIVGAAVGLFVMQRVIGNRMIEAPRFVLAVFVGGAVAMLLYVLIKDGGTAILKRQAGRRAAAGAVPAAPATPIPTATPTAAAAAVVDEDDFEDEDAPPQRPLRAARQRPLRPPNR